MAFSSYTTHQNFVQIGEDRIPLSACYDLVTEANNFSGAIVEGKPLHLQVPNLGSVAVFGKKGIPHSVRLPTGTKAYLHFLNPLLFYQTSDGKVLIQTRFGSTERMGPKDAKELIDKAREAEAVEQHYSGTLLLETDRYGIVEARAQKGKIKTAVLSLGQDRAELDIRILAKTVESLGNKLATH